MSDLWKKQALFARLFPRLLDYLHGVPVNVTIREVWRPPEMVAIYARDKRGSAASVHPDSCAADLVLRDASGEPLADDHQIYRSAGAYWKTLDPACRWGGDFRKLGADGKMHGIFDPGHFSVTPDDRRA